MAKRKWDYMGYVGERLLAEDTGLVVPFSCLSVEVGLLVRGTQITLTRVWLGKSWEIAQSHTRWAATEERLAGLGALGAAVLPLPLTGGDGAPAVLAVVLMLTRLPVDRSVNVNGTILTVACAVVLALYTGTSWV